MEWLAKVATRLQIMQMPIARLLGLLVWTLHASEFTVVHTERANAFGNQPFVHSLEEREKDFPAMLSSGPAVSSAQRRFQARARVIDSPGWREQKTERLSVHRIEPAAHG
jgi:hypothetical protein